MGKYTRAIIAGFVAAAVMTFLMSFVFEGLTPYLYGIFTGGFFAYIFANLAGNKKLPIADAGEKQAALAQAAGRQGAAGGVPRGLRRQAGGAQHRGRRQGVAQLTAPKFTVLACRPGPTR